MKTILTKDPEAMGRWVAERAAEDLRTAISERGYAAVVVATGASQFAVLKNLVAQDDVDWQKVEGFHLDEYVGLPPDHPASFCKYLRERFVDHVPLKDFHYLRGDQEPTKTIERVGALIKEKTIDVALVGIGENGHLAFNDPPANFETLEPYLLVKLDADCRQQQVGEGWFDSLDDVPTKAISMSVQQIMKANKIYCSVPDQRKADAVRRTLGEPVSPDIPASILRHHEHAVLVIDRAAASELDTETRQSLETV